MATYLVPMAREVALTLHAGLVRPNKGREPYSIHLQEVADLVERSKGGEQEVAAAWLHDTVEDTAATVENIRRTFGDGVAHIVEGLTDLPDTGTMPTLRRKIVQAERLRQKSQAVKRVKIADGISNLRSVEIDPPVDWDKLTTLDYITGCAIVAYQCRGISDYLDMEFYKAYRSALLAHV